MHKAELVNKFSLFSFGREPGIGTWLSDAMHPHVLARLQQLDADPLSQ
jgi:hypothetical protein